jgi:filamentous hemagglutinin
LRRRVSSDQNNWATPKASIGGSIGGEAAGAVINGAYADKKRDDAADVYKAAYDLADYNSWKEGSIARAEMQAAGAAIASIVAGKLNELSGTIAGAKK